MSEDPFAHLASVPLGQWLELLASGEPVWAGGSAAAVAAAQGWALLAMATRIIAKRLISESSQHRALVETALEHEAQSLQLLAAAGKDAYSVSLVFSSRPNSPARQQALKWAIEVPIAVAEHCLAGLDQLLTLMPVAPKALRPDLYVAFGLLKIGLQASLTNAQTNIRLLDDNRETADRITALKKRSAHTVDRVRQGLASIDPGRDLEDKDVGR